MIVDASVAQHAGVTPRAHSQGVESLMLAESVQAFLRSVRRGADLRDQGQVEADVVRVVTVRSNVAFCVRRPVQRVVIMMNWGRSLTSSLDSRVVVGRAGRVRDRELHGPVANRRR